MIVAPLFLAALLALAWAAFCAGAETAFLSVSRERILHLARAGGRKAKNPLPDASVVIVATLLLSAFALA